LSQSFNTLIGVNEEFVMHNLKQKLVAASFAAVTVPALALPAMAGPVAVRGVVTKIDGDMVTLRQPWGETITIKVDQRRQTRAGMNPLVEGTDAAITLDPKTDNPSVAIKVCTCVSEVAPYVAVAPIPVPQVGGPVNFGPRPAPPPREVPAPPPPRILY
jgi:hypothetical protein